MTLFHLGERQRRTAAVIAGVAISAPIVVMGLPANTSSEAREPPVIEAVSVTSPSAIPKKLGAKTVKITKCKGDAAYDTELIRKAGIEAGTAGKVEFANGQRCVVDTLTLKPRVSYIAKQGKPRATLVGASPKTELRLSDNTRLLGLKFCNLTLNAQDTKSAAIGNSTLGSSGCEDTSIVASGSSRFRIINNDFISIAGIAILGYSPTQLTIDGNHFNGCGEDCIDLPEGAGRDSLIIRNIFLDTHLAAMEIGYAATAPTINLRVIKNWAAHSLAKAYAYKMAYSLPLNGEGSTGTLIKDNYADGTTPDGNGAICIELSGSGRVTRNTCKNFDFGAIGYGMNGRCEGLEEFSHNTFVNTVYGTAVSYFGCGSDVFKERNTSTTTKKVPAKPARVPWP